MSRSKHVQRKMANELYIKQTIQLSMSKSWDVSIVYVCSYHYNC